MKFSRPSISFSLLVSILLAALAPLISFMAIDHLILRYKQQTIVRYETKARTVLQNIQYSFVDLVTEIEQLAKIVHVAQGLSNVRLQDLVLDQGSPRTRSIKKLLLLDEQGRIVDLYPGMEQYLGLDLHRQPYFQTSKRVYVGNLTAFLTEPSMYLPIAVKAGPQRVLVAFIDAGWLSERLKTIELTFDLMAVLEKNSFPLFWRAEPPLQSSTFELQRIYQEIHSRAGHFVPYRLRHFPGHAFVAAVAGTTWRLVLYKRDSDLFREAIFMEKNFKIFFLLFFILISVTIYFVGRLFARAHMGIIAELKASQSWQVKISNVSRSFPELNQIVDAMNEMIERIGSKELELQRSQTRMMQLFSSLRESLIIFDRQQRILDCNTATLMWLVPTDLATLRTLTLKDLMPNFPSLDQVLTALDQTGHTPEHLYEIAFCNGHSPLPSENLWAEVSFHRLGDDFLLLARDIGDKRKMQTQLFQASKLASIGELASGIGHEVNNPLQVILGTMPLLGRAIRSALPGTAASMAVIDEHLGRIQNSSQRIKEIVYGLKSFSQMEGEQMAVVDLHHAIFDAVQLIRTIYEKEGIDILLHLKAEHHLVMANLGKIQQVIMNLMSNARDAMQKTVQRRITITTGNRNGQLWIEVTDAGSGIPEDQVPLIFNSFFTTKERGKGTGLGLSISLAIIHDLNGHLELSRTSSDGSTFLITLPLVGEQTKTTLASWETSATPVARPPLVVSSGLAQLKILFVDDEPEILDVLLLSLQCYGVQPMVCSTPELAITLAKEHQFDIIFTDFKMPQMNGDQLIGHLRLLQPATTCYYLLTGSLLHLNDHMGGAVWDGYLEKPFQIEQIVDLIQKSQDPNFKKSSGR